LKQSGVLFLGLKGSLGKGSNDFKSFALVYALACF
jgi:hypothetical protein